MALTLASRQVAAGLLLGASGLAIAKPRLTDAECAVLMERPRSADVQEFARTAERGTVSKVQSSEDLPGHYRMSGGEKIILLADGTWGHFDQFSEYPVTGSWRTEDGKVLVTERSGASRFRTFVQVRFKDFVALAEPDDCFIRADGYIESYVFKREGK